jgi:hypothetical protein
MIVISVSTCKLHFQLNNASKIKKNNNRQLDASEKTFEQFINNAIKIITFGAKKKAAIVPASRDL